MNNIILLVFLAALTVSIFSAARYSDASLYINDSSLAYEGLGFGSGGRNNISKTAVADKKLERKIEEYSLKFVKAAFGHDENTLCGMLAKETEYVCSEDGSSFIRYVSGGQHVEGYMATDKQLEKAKQEWCVMENGGTVVSGMNIYIKGIKSPQHWYIHYRKVFGKWKLYMLENGV